MHDAAPRNLTDQILSSVDGQGDSPIRAANFEGLASPDAVHQALSRLAKTGQLERIGRGVYRSRAQAGSAGGRRSSKYGHIIAVAAPLFGRQGYYGVSMRDIAEAASLKIATLYNYFPDKNALYEAVVRAAWEEGARRTLDLKKSAGPPAEQLRAWICNVIEFHFEQSPAAMIRDRELLFAQAGGEPPEDLLAATFDRTLAVRELLRALDPPILKTMSVRRVSELIYGVCYGIIKFRPAQVLVEPGRDDLSKDAITADVLRFVSAALGFPLPGPSGTSA